MWPAGYIVSCAGACIMAPTLHYTAGFSIEICAHLGILNIKMLISRLSAVLPLAKLLVVI